MTVPTTPANPVGLSTILLFVTIPRYEAGYVSKQLLDTLKPKLEDNTIRKLQTAIYNREYPQGLLDLGIPYPGIGIHDIQEVHDIQSYGNLPHVIDRGISPSEVKRVTCPNDICQNGGKAVMVGGECICRCPKPYVGCGCQFRGDNCKLNSYSDCFLQKPKGSDPLKGYWGLAGTNPKFHNHHFLEYFGRHQTKADVKSERLCLETTRQYRLTFKYTMTKKNLFFQTYDSIAVFWKPDHKPAIRLFIVKGLKKKAKQGTACVNVPAGFGHIVFTGSCINAYHCDAFFSLHSRYPLKEGTQIYLDDVKLSKGPCPSPVLN